MKSKYTNQSKVLALAASAAAAVAAHSKSRQARQILFDPQTAAYQVPPSLGISRKEHSNALPFPSPVHESESESEVTQSCSTLHDPMDCILPGSSVHGIFPAIVLDWVATAFS